MGEVVLSSVRTAGSRLALGGSRQILGFLGRSRPKRRPKGSQDGERGVQMGEEAFKNAENGGLGECKCRPEASQNDQKMKLHFQSVFGERKKECILKSGRLLAPFWSPFWEPKPVQNRSQNRLHF